MSRRTLCYFLFGCMASIASLAQVVAPPVPQRLVVHSNVLNEDRVIWVRMPAAAQGKKESYAVLYMTDAGTNVNEIGSTIDFLADTNFMPPLIVVAIANTDRNRDLTPSHAGVKHSDGTVDPVPTSGGADKFLDFIQTELVPEIEKRYSTHPYRIFAGHSLGGLLAVYALINRPELFNAYIATSPSLWWDDFRVLHQAQEFFAKQKEFNKVLFFALGNEGGDMSEGFEQLRKTLSANRPTGFLVKSEHYNDEIHSSTELLGHYDGLRTIFTDWRMPLDAKTDLPTGGLEGVAQHYRALSERFGFRVSAERDINSLGYNLLGNKKIDEALAAFRRNVELYPQSANVYDSLADGFEAAGKPDLAVQNVEKAVEIATQTADPLLPAFRKHLDRLVAAGKSAPGKAK
ncbi:MAG TPA: alpha/beta hydrolase-fold protein [Terriglobales bacterium]|jgi:predicted alpha/beta superfamily hydrolase|nr:alpha/beta hydrolase-fold protein [Terriglobales bacterium]